MPIIRPYPTGACAPSDTAHAALDLSAAETAPQYRLDPNAPPIDLVRLDPQGPDRYPDWLARIQGQRQTCVAFAVAACIELLRADGKTATGKDFEPLSPQFLYWHMRRLGDLDSEKPPGWQTGATKLGHANKVLAENGICRWSTCHYDDRLAPGEAIEGPEPDPAAEREAAESYFSKSAYQEFRDPDNRQGGAAQIVYDHLRQNRPAAIAIPVFYSTDDRLETNWDNPVTTNSGKVVDPAEGWEARKDDPNGPPPGHAVCVIGFQPDDREPTGGWFIFRNSRGMNWAAHLDPEKRNNPRVPARGYGAVSATYIERYCWEILSPVP
jgi:hypothetical protein